MLVVVVVGGEDLPVDVAVSLREVVAVQKIEHHPQ